MIPDVPVISLIFFDILEKFCKYSSLFNQFWKFLKRSILIFIFVKASFYFTFFIYFCFLIKEALFL